MADHWTLTVRSGPRVQRMRFPTLGETIDALEERIDALAPEARRHAIHAAGRRYDPARQVAVRAEIAGPGGLLGGPRGGVDMRGDGSVEAYTGRVKRRLVPLLPGESAHDALRRVLQEV
ncbi:MAG TPA: hypothetical protein VNY52_07485 [Solirubrobacteraceae bacterium]|jgi:hypothetical protein|nr:hypothetical protein [Solirubrobacteraceae bacterium]